MKHFLIIILFLCSHIPLFAQDSLLQYSMMPGSKDRLLHYTLYQNTLTNPEQAKEYLQKNYPFQITSLTTEPCLLMFSLADTLLMTKNKIPTRIDFSCTITFDYPALFDFYMIYFQGEKQDGTPWLTTCEEAFPNDLLFNDKGKVDKLRAEYKVTSLKIFNDIVSGICTHSIE